MTDTMSRPDPEIAALSDEEFCAHLYAQGIRFGEAQPTKVRTPRQQDRAMRRLAKLIRKYEKQQIKAALKAARR